jgi:tetratricopeptide (TPR) repeat protein
MEYDDFVIQILHGQDGSYGVLVESPVGSGKGRFELSGLGAAARGALGPVVTRDVRPAESGGGPRSRTAGEIGDDLFQALFRDGVGNLFYKNLGRIEGSGRGLRIRMRIDLGLGHVMALPWELLHIADSDDFLGADSNFSVVRSLDVMRSVVLASKANRLRILAVALSPQGYDNLDLPAERLILEHAAKRCLSADIVFRENPGRKELRSELRKGGFHVLHIMGHGAFDGATGSLVFAGPQRQPEFVDGRELAAELKGCSDLRLVVLNTCHSARSVEEDGQQPFTGVAAALVQGGVHAVVAMRSRISDTAALEFSETFYRQLAAQGEGNEIDAAVAEGRLAIQRVVGQDGGWDLPVLFLSREDVRLPKRRSFARALLLAFVLLFLILGGCFIYGQSYKAIGLNEKGALLAREGHLEEARGFLLEALRLDPGYAAPLTNLAGVEEHMGRYEEALQHARAAVEAAPSQASYQYNLGRLLVRLGRDEDAIPSLRQATKQESCHASAFNELGEVYLRLDRPAEARVALDAGLHCDPTLGPLVKNRGRADLEEGKPGEAIRDFEDALHLYGREGRAGLEEPTYGLAVAYSQTGRRDLACQGLRDFFRLDPAGVTPWARDARSLAQQQRCDGVFYTGRHK